MDPDSEASHSEDALSSGDLHDICSVEEYNDVEAKQRASVLWLLSKAYMPKIPPELYEPCYRDQEGNDRLKPQIVHALANAELYCLALANIYADPNYHNLNHHGIIQVLTRKGIEINEPMDANLTETVLVQTAPIRMNAHMAVIEGIMALFIKEVLIPEKVMEVVSRFCEVDPEGELPYDCEEAALLWINKCCLKMRHKIEEEMSTSHSPDSPDSSHLHASFIALAQDLGDLSDGCCLAALLSLYCPRYFKWQDIHLHDPIRLADSVHNLQLVQRFCHDHLPQDIYCLSLEDMVYMHPSIIPNVLAFVADLMYIFEIRPPKHVCRPGAKTEREDDAKMVEINYLNGQRQSPLQNCRIKNFQKSASPIPDLRSGNYEVTRSGSWQAPQKSFSNRKISMQEDRKDGLKSLRRTHSVNFSEVNRRGELSVPSYNSQRFQGEDDEELASYFPSRQPHSQSQYNLLDQDENRRLNRHVNDHSQKVQTAQGHYPVYHSDKPYHETPSPGHLESLSENNELIGGKWAEPREPAKSGLQRSPSSYEIHQLSPSKQTLPKGRGYSCKRSQSDLHLSQDRGTFGKLNSEEDNGMYQVQSVSHEHYSPRTFTREPRKSRHSYHEAMHGSFNPTQNQASWRHSADVGKGPGGDAENQNKQLSGSLTWRKPKDLFSPSEWNKENVGMENNNHQNSEESRVGDDQGEVVSFANLSKQKNNSGSAINIVYSHQEKDIDQSTYKKPTRPGFLHISKSHPSNDGCSPTSNYNSSEWQKSEPTADSSVAAQMHDIRLKLEEKRKRIEHEKALLEKLSKKQREKMGKAAFLQAVKAGTPNRDDYYSRNRQFSVEDVSEDLDTVRRKWLERKGAEMEYENDMHSEDIQFSIEQLNSSLSDLQTDISRLTEQQEVIQKMVKNNAPSQNDMQAYFLHEQNVDSRNKMPNKWAEPVNNYPNSSVYSMAPDIPPQVSGRGHWGQPVIPFGGYQPPQQQNIPMWQQNIQPMRPPSVEPQLMFSQPINMQPQMYDRPPATAAFSQGGFNMHPQQMSQNSYNNYYNSNPYYANEMPPGNTQQPGQYSYHQSQPTNYPVMQNTFSRNVNQGDGRGFHLHRNASQTYMSDDVDNYHMGNNPVERQFDVHRSDSKLSLHSNQDKGALTIDTDAFGRHAKGSEPQYSPPSKPVLGKTFRIPKSKVPSPSSPNYKQSSFPHHQETESQNDIDQAESQTSEKENQLNDKGFYISFEEEPRKPKPKLKPKHLKARNQQKKIEFESRDNQESRHQDSESFSHLDQNQGLRPDVNKSSVEQRPKAPPPAPGVGFVVAAAPVEEDPDKELEMTRRKEMIMMMSLRRRAEQEKKKNEKQQEYMMKKDEERQKREQQEKKKEEEKLRRQLILEQYRQRKAQEDEDGTSGPSRGRDETTASSRGATMTRSKSRSASVTRPRQRSGHISNTRNQNLSSASSLDSSVGRGSQLNLAGGYPDEVSSEHGYAPSPCRTRNYPYSSPISPTSYPSSPGPLFSGILGGAPRNRSSPSDGLSDTSSTVSSVWASEYTGPKLFVKPSTKSNRSIVINAVSAVLAGAVNSDTKRKVLDEIERSEGKHFLILFRDAGCQFRALYSYNPETEDVIKLHGIGPRVITDKMFDRFYKYNSGGKSFTQIHTKRLTATIDAFTIQNTLWQSKKNAVPKRDCF